MDNIEIFDRIPTATHPLEKHYMLPITQFLHQWVNDELFYVDFVDLCPFNRELASHFYVQRFISPMHKNWASKSFALFCADRYSSHLLYFVQTIYSCHVLFSVPFKTELMT